MNESECSCKKTHCSRHGDCAACREHHAELNSPTACERAAEKQAKREERAARRRARRG